MKYSTVYLNHSHTIINGAASFKPMTSLDRAAAAAAAAAAATSSKSNYKTTIHQILIQTHE